MRRASALSLFAGILLLGCENQGASIRAATTPCVVALPEKYSGDTELLLAAKADLEAAGSSGQLGASFQSYTEGTYQKLGDSDVACGLLLRSLVCLQSRPQSGPQVEQFVGYLKETKACEARPAADLVVENAIQIFADDAFRFEHPPIWIDIIWRNSGNVTAAVSKLELHFDDHLRSPREPQNMTRVTSIYAIAIDSHGARVDMQSNEDSGQPVASSPADAFYPDAYSPKLLVTVPLAESVSAHSVDRVRIKLNILDAFESRGPREQAKIVAFYNNGSRAEFGPIALKPQEPCLQILVPGPDGKRAERQICR